MLFFKEQRMKRWGVNWTPWQLDTPTNSPQGQLDTSQLNTLPSGHLTIWTPWQLNTLPTGHPPNSTPWQLTPRSTQHLTMSTPYQLNTLPTHPMSTQHLPSGHPTTGPNVNSTPFRMQASCGTSLNLPTQNIFWNTYFGAWRAFKIISWAILCSFLWIF